MKRCLPLCQSSRLLVYFYFCFAFGLVPYRSTEKKSRPGLLPQAKPPLRTFHALPGHVHTSIIRTGVFWGCSGDGSLKRLGLGTAPALFPSSPRHIPSRKHFICGTGKAYVGLESAVWKAAGNRLCNVFGGVVLVFTVSADLWQAEPTPQ